MLATNKVQVVTGATPHGQGHETSWSMIVADKLGVSPDDVDVLHSDTAISPLGLDTYGSRSLVVGGVAIDMACDRVIDKARRLPPINWKRHPKIYSLSVACSASRAAPTDPLPRGSGLCGVHRP